jgi:HEAT repeat protein
LIAVALGDQPDLRPLAARALDKWGTRDALLMLVTALADADVLKQERAKEMLGILKDPAAVDPLADLAEKGNTAAVDALAAMGPVAEDGALRLLNCADPAVQLAAVRALGEIGTSRSIAPLRAVARSRPNNLARQDDIAALTKINDRLAAQAREEAKRRIKTVPTTNAENR